MTKICLLLPSRFLAWPVIAFIVINGLGTGKTNAAESRKPLTLFVAASLAPVVETMATGFGKSTGFRVRVSAAASSVLARQVASGAPADIVILANPEWMQWLEDKKLITANGRRDLASNRLSLLRHSDTTLPDDLSAAIRKAATRGRIAMADPDHVPAGIYGKAALEKLNLWDLVAPGLARSANAPAAVAQLSRGEVSAAISYRTDARLSDRVVVHALFPATLHPPVRYQIAVVAGATRTATKRLYDFLRHPDRLSGFRAFGFAAPAAP